MAIGADRHPVDIAKDAYKSALASTSSVLSEKVSSLKAENLEPSMEIEAIFNGGECTTYLECTYRYTVSTDFYRTEGKKSTFKSLQTEIQADYHGNSKILNVYIKN